jgi:hypothetical protein
VWDSKREVYRFDPKFSPFCIPVFLIGCISLGLDSWVTPCVNSRKVDYRFGPKFFLYCYIPIFSFGFIPKFSLFDVVPKFSLVDFVPNFWYIA